MATSRKDVDDQRRAFQVAIQDVVREFEEEGVVIGCVLTYEVIEKDGGRHLAHRSFDVEGDRLVSWTAEGYLRDHMRVVALQAVQGLVGPEDDEESDPGGT